MEPQQEKNHYEAKKLGSQLLSLERGIQRNLAHDLTDGTARKLF